MAFSSVRIYGISGYSGYSGSSGYSGYSGPSGFSGYSGISGYSGQAGNDGVGSVGVSGFSGKSGFSGYSGATGATGTSGFSGYSGPSGFSGYSGPSGFSGYSGPSGYSGYSGPSGFSGYSAYSGIFGGDSHRYAYDSGLLNSDPGSGKLRFDSGTLSAAANMYIDHVNADGVTISAWTAALASSNNTSSRGYIRVYKLGLSSTFVVYKIVGAATVNLAYDGIPISHVTSSGSFADKDPVVITFSRTGDSGFSGYSGTSGYSGYSGYSGISGFSGYSGNSGISGNAAIAWTAISAQTTAANTATLDLERSRGTLASPATIVANDRLGAVRFYGHNGSAFILGGEFVVQASETWSGTNEGVTLVFRGVRKATTTLATCFSANADGLSLGAGIAFTFAIKTADYTITAQDMAIGVSDTTSARTITLPDTSTMTVGKSYIIKDTSGGAATHNITIQVAGGSGQLIDGAGTKVINTNYGVVRLIADTADSGNWFTW